jgi:hypothetical protein
MSLCTITLFTFTIIRYFTGLHEAVQGHSVVFQVPTLWGIDWPGFPLNLTKQLYSRIPVQVSHLMCHYSIPCYTWNSYLIYLRLILVFHWQRFPSAAPPYLWLILNNPKEQFEYATTKCRQYRKFRMSSLIPKSLTVVSPWNWCLWWTNFVFIAGNTTCLLSKILSFFHKFYDETLCLSLLQHVMKLYLHDY